MKRKDPCMKKSYRISAAVYPCPVILIATYNEDGTVNVMNAAWGCPIDTDLVGVCLSPDHKTNENFHRTGAFTLSFATASTAAEADFFGLASGKEIKDKLGRVGFHASPSSKANAPVIEEFPFAMVCLLDHEDPETGMVYGKIVEVLAEESCLNADGKFDLDLAQAVCYDSFSHSYRRIGEKVAPAFASGKKFIQGE